MPPFIGRARYAEHEANVAQLSVARREQVGACGNGWIGGREAVAVTSSRFCALAKDDMLANNSLIRLLRHRHEKAIAREAKCWR